MPGGPDALSGDDVFAALANFARTGARWLLTTSFAERATNEPIELGHWRPLNLEAPPFEFPPPVRSISDVPVDRDRYLDKRLALWELGGQRGVSSGVATSRLSR